MHTAAQKALDKAKIQLMARPDSAFFTTVCFSMKHLFSDEIPTACTDGTTIKFNPDFFLRLDIKQQLFVLVHETLHVCFMHMLRRGSREPRRWNVAGDYVINQLLHDRGYTLTEGALYAPQYAGMSTEQVYDLLEDQPLPPCDMDIVGSEGSKPKEELENEISNILVRAAIQSKLQNNTPGSIPSDIQIYLDNLLNPKLPWHQILRKYTNQLAKADYSFRRPNRRFFPDNYLPSLHSETLMNIAIAVDSSGSVSDADFKQFVSEVYTILKRLKPKEITLIQFDCSIKSIDKVTSPADLMKLKFTGRGGTDIEPVMEWADQHKPQLLLLFSDGEFYFRRTSYKPPMVWLIHNNEPFTAPFGKVIHYKQNH